MNVRRDSIYTVRNDAPSQIYGEFPGCAILGDPCTIRVEELPDGDSRAVDILGFNSFRRGGIAIHISGLDDFGRKAHPSRITGLGMYQCIWDRPGHHPSGTGCVNTDPVVILASDQQHIAFWGDTKYYVTLEGIYHWDAASQSKFTAEDIAAYIDNGRERYMQLSARQVSAIRRLLEACVGASNNMITSDDGKIGVARLVRDGGRYKYRWVRTEK